MDRLGIVTRSYSYSLFLKVVGLLLGGAMAAAAVVYLTVQQQISGDYSEVLYTLHHLKGVLLSRTLLVGGGVGVLIVAAVAAINLFYSHRVAGPLFRIGRELERIREGDLTVRIRLRKGDVAVPLADGVSSLAEAHGRRVRALIEACDELVAGAEAVESGGEGDLPALRENLKRIRGELSGLRLR